MIEHILFDLDNTLYSCSNEINLKLTRRMFQFIADFLSVSVDEAKNIQKEQRYKYGTTLEWLEDAYSFSDRDTFFAAVHPESEIDELQPDPNLRDFLISLNKPMSVLTNAPMQHAERVLEFFNIRDLFLGVFDLTYHNCKGKPYADCYLQTLKALNKTVEETVFLDDYPPYVIGYTKVGGKAVLIDEKNKYNTFSDETGIPSIASIYDLPKIIDKM